MTRCANTEPNRTSIRFQFPLMNCLKRKSSKDFTKITNQQIVKKPRKPSLARFFYNPKENVGKQFSKIQLKFN